MDAETRGSENAERRRRGPFWDAIDGRAPMPPAARLLGWELVDVDPHVGTIAVSFEATVEMTNPVGDIQGGFLAAMLDDTLGPALVSSLDEGQFAPTLDLHVQFLRAARPGRITGHGRVRHRGRSIAFLTGELVDDADAVVATADATALIRATTPA